jgi:hypothetical protein
MVPCYLRDFEAPILRHLSLKSQKQISEMGIVDLEFLSRGLRNKIRHSDNSVHL